MAFVISNGWDVAHHHIHESFEHIGKSIVANLGISNTFTEVRDNASWAKCLGLSTQVRAAFIAENKEAIKATVLFQAGMEAWISWAYTKPELSGIAKPSRFKEKWIEAFVQLDIVHDFTHYGSFYTSQRNAIIHPGSQADIETVAKINCSDTLKGIEHGWEAMVAMGPGINLPFDQDSFQTMCRVHGVQLKEIPNVGALLSFETQLLEKHQKGIDSKTTRNE